MPSPPDYIRKLLNSCPRASKGVHAWLFSTAKALNPLYEDKDDLARIIAAACVDCGRQVTEHEIADAINNSLPAKLRKSKADRVPRWPLRDEEAVNKVLMEHGKLSDLTAASPVPVEDLSTEEVIDALFPNNPLLCCGLSTHEFDTKAREAWRGRLDEQQFIVPSPMSAIEGTTKNGRPSKRSLSNTGPRRFLVLEFDQGSPDEHAAILLRLAKAAPLALAVFSGGKSLHGWFFVADETEDKIYALMRCGVQLGADHATWIPCQFVRMPNGIREGGARQSVFYFNPSTTK